MEIRVETVWEQKGWNHCSSEIKIKGQRGVIRVNRLRGLDYPAPSRIMVSEIPEHLKKKLIETIKEIESFALENGRSLFGEGERAIEQEMERLLQ